MSLQDAMQESANEGGGKDDDENTVCFMCKMHSPPSGYKGKTFKWIECNEGHKKFHL